MFVCFLVWEIDKLHTCTRDVRVQILIWFQTFLLFTKPHFQTFNSLKSTSFQAFQIISDFSDFSSQTLSHPWWGWYTCTCTCKSFSKYNWPYRKYGVPSKEGDFAQDCACAEWILLWHRRQTHSGFHRLYTQGWFFAKCPFFTSVEVNFKFYILATSNIFS